jgi:hypothetical protein
MSSLSAIILELAKSILAKSSKIFISFDSTTRVTSSLFAKKILDKFGQFDFAFCFTVITSSSGESAVRSISLDDREFPVDCNADNRAIAEIIAVAVFENQIIKVDENDSYKIVFFEEFCGLSSSLCDLLHLLVSVSGAIVSSQRQGDDYCEKRVSSVEETPDDILRYLVTKKIQQMVSDSKVRQIYLFSAGETKINPCWCPDFEPSGYPLTVVEVEIQLGDIVTERSWSMSAETRGVVSVEQLLSQIETDDRIFRYDVFRLVVRSEGVSGDRLLDLPEIAGAVFDDVMNSAKSTDKGITKLIDAISGEL